MNVTEQVRQISAYRAQLDELGIQADHRLVRSFNFDPIVLMRGPEGITLRLLASLREHTAKAVRL